MGRAITKDMRAFKRSYAQRPCIRDAALAAGYAPSVAKQGLTKLAKPAVRFVQSKQRQLNKLEMLGASITAEAQENIARGSIFRNIAERTDKAIASTKLAMQDKRVNMLTPDSMTGIIVIQRPAELPILDVTALPEHIDDAK